jgi:hypothetical protein
MNKTIIATVIATALFSAAAHADDDTAVLRIDQFTIPSQHHTTYNVDTIIHGVPLADGGCQIETDIKIAEDRGVAGQPRTVTRRLRNGGSTEITETYTTEHDWAPVATTTTTISGPASCRDTLAATDDTMNEDIANLIPQD